MYKINKSTTIYDYVARGVFTSNKANLAVKKNKKQTVIFLRSPKHFNIGKHKIFFFNNFYKKQIIDKRPLPLKPLLLNKCYIFNLFVRKFNFSFSYKFTSIRIKTKTKIKFM